MDDAFTPQRRKIGASERGKEIWADDRSITAPNLLGLLETEGYSGLSRRKINMWLKAWRAETGVEREVSEPQDVPGMLSAYSQLIADAGLTLRECEMDHVQTTFKGLLATADAIGAKIVTSLEGIQVNKATDIMALAGAMGQMAAAAASVQESAAKIIEQRGDNARVINPMAGGNTGQVIESSPMLRALNAWSGAKSA